MNESISQLLGLGSVPVVVALVQVFKPLVTDKRLYPVMAIVLAMGIHGLLWLAFGGASLSDLGQHLITGTLVGLAASGLYSGVSTIKEGRQSPPPA